MQQIERFHTIEWDESMATGIADIDKQHQYLIKTLREMNDKLLDDDSDLLLSHVVKDLLGYALIHFEVEEALMLRYGYMAAYPEEAQAHIAQHRTFSRRVVTLRDQLRERQTVSRIEILRFLNHWLSNHVLGIDQALGKFLVQEIE
jgi:hemerythrin-like metal-binding protein